MVTTVTIYSDLHCPWATIAVHRLRAARDRLGLDVVLDQRAWPLEWINEQATPRHIVEPEATVLAAHEPWLFSAFQGASWPSTFLPAFELVAAARRAHGLRAAEDVDYHVRVRFFREAADMSLRHQLRAALQAAAKDTPVADFDPDRVMRVWESEPVRADVVADYERSRQLPIQGSPTILWPDGEVSHNPGMPHEWERGLPRLGETDPGALERLLLRHVPG